MALSKRLQNYCKGLSRAGGSCSVYICHKYLCKNSGNADSMEYGTIDDTSFCYIVGRFKSKFKLKRGIDYRFLDPVRSSWYALKHVKKKDIVFCCFNDLFFFSLLIFVCKLKGIKIVRELNEYPYIFGVQSVKKKLYRAIELRFLFPFFDGFVAISTSLEMLANRFKKKSAKIIKVPILVEEKNNIHKISKKPLDSDYIIHTGTMIEQKDGITVILEAFSIAVKKIPKDIQLVFTGPQAVRPNKYDDFIKKLQIADRVIFLGMVSSDRLNQLQIHADLTVINKLKNIQNENCFPTKLGEMMINETPVITTTIGEASQFLIDGFNAYIIEPGNSEQMAKKIIEAFDMKTKRKTITTNAKITAEKEFNPTLHGKRLFDYFRTIIST